MTIFRSLLMMATVASIGFAVASCTDKIDNSVKPGDNPQEQVSDVQMTKAQKFWNVASQLVDVDEFTEDYEDKTFEPVYGQAIGTASDTRYVFTNTPAAAAARFADLVERDDIDENTASYTFTDPDVGTLVYTKGSGRTLATVDVDIKQIPSLRKIVYMPGAYANAEFDNRAYYRFGDVVKRQAQGYDGEPFTEYWVCVRPSFGKEGKGDSHWVCLGELPKKYVWHYHSDTNNQDYYLPTLLGNSHEHMQNLAEMLYAILNPTEWYMNVNNYSDAGLPMFHDFDPDKLMYHNDHFWKNVQNAWKHYQILEKVMDYSAGMESLNTMLDTRGLYLLYNGYSWWTFSSWNCSLYQAHFKNNTAERTERNMHKATFETLTRNMQRISVDCRKTGPRHIQAYKQFFGYDDLLDDDTQPRWTIRHATGKELAADGRYNVKQPINGVETVYRYYEYINDTDLEEPAEITEAEYVIPEVKVDDKEVGDIIGRDGVFYKTSEQAEAYGGGAMAMVVYLGGDKRVEKDKEWNGLAIALKDLRAANGAETFSYCGNRQENQLCTNNIVSKAHLGSRLDGWAMTRRMQGKQCNAGHSHDAAEAVATLDKVQGFSEWFIPSSGQWDLAMQGLGFGSLKETEDDWAYTGAGQWRLDAVGGAELIMAGQPYMTTTEYSIYDNSTDIDRVSGYVNVFINKDDHQLITFDHQAKASSNARFRVRPFIAFKYDKGGTVNPTEPWQPLTMIQADSWIGEDGAFYRTSDDVFASTGHMPVAYVAYYGDNFRVENQFYQGLAVGVRAQEFEGLSWNELNDKVAQYTTRLPDNVRKQRGFSSWFVPTDEHWMMVFKQGFGVHSEHDLPDTHQHEIARFFPDNNLRNSALKGPYWTSTSYRKDDTQAYYLDLIDNHLVRLEPLNKAATEVDGQRMRLRPMIAFE